MKFLMTAFSLTLSLSSAALGNGSTTILSTLMCDKTPVVVVDDSASEELTAAFYQDQEFLISTTTSKSKFVKRISKFYRSTSSDAIWFFVTPHAVYTLGDEFYYMQSMTSTSNIVNIVSEKYLSYFTSSQSCYYSN